MKQAAAISMLGSVFFLSSCGGPPKPTTAPEVIEADPLTIEQLETDLRSGIPQQKAQAILELADRGERKYIPIARKFLKEERDSAVKSSAAIALGVYKDAISLSPILDLLQKGSEVEVSTVLEAVARMESPGAASRILFLLNDEDDTIRMLTVDTLIRIHAQSVGSKVLSAAKENKDPRKSKDYVVAIGKLRIKDGEDYLLGLASLSDPGPTLAAIYLALGRIGSKKGTPLLAKAVSGDFDKGRENAVIALVEAKDANAIPLMFPLLSYSDREIRYRAADVLIGIPSTLTGPKLLSILNSESLESKGPAAHVLGLIKYLPARTSIEAALLNSLVPDREIIAQALGHLGDKRSLAILYRVIKENSGEAKYGAAWALGGIGSEEALPVLEQALNSNDRKLARISAESLGMIASPKSLSMLDQKTHEFPELAPSTLSAISSVPGVESRRILEKYAESEDINLHQFAVTQLGARKERESLEVLIKLLDDEKGPRNRKLITAALRSITGKRFFSKNEWMNWYKNRN
ncbi:HEAT repeat domain-containing protein [Leptospira perolatii]|uniref:HEAT repeat domain-containing protein n=1 Tax=Leptospira perolatii TaxID=2023191 RepID=UPI001FB0091C|nr:HEAT repeat domain-containing protein [Leptospira perolatii]